MQTIGERLKWARGEAELTQSEVGRRAGLAYSHVGFIEQGRFATLATKTAVALSAVLGVTPEWLLFGTEPHPSKETIVQTVAAWREPSEGAA